MKLLENSKLDAIGSTLSTETPVCDITTRSVTPFFVWLIRNIDDLLLLHPVWKAIRVRWPGIRRNCTNNCEMNPERRRAIWKFSARHKRERRCTITLCWTPRRPWTIRIRLLVPYPVMTSHPWWRRYLARRWFSSFQPWMRPSSRTTSLVLVRVKILVEKPT